MDFAELERLAAHETPMPEGISLSAQAAYLALRALYREYHRGGVGKEQAAAEKRLIRKEYAQRRENEEHLKEVIHRWQEDIRASEAIRAEINLAEDKTPAELFLMAVECISRMTGDRAFLKNGEKVQERQMRLEK